MSAGSGPTAGTAEVRDDDNRLDARHELSEFTDVISLIVLDTPEPVTVHGEQHSRPNRPEPIGDCGDSHLRTAGAPSRSDAGGRQERSTRLRDIGQVAGDRVAFRHSKTQQSGSYPRYLLAEFGVAPHAKVVQPARFGAEPNCWAVVEHREA